MPTIREKLAEHGFTWKQALTETAWAACNCPVCGHTKVADALDLPLEEFEEPSRALDCPIARDNYHQPFRDALLLARILERMDAGVAAGKLYPIADADTVAMMIWSSELAEHTSGLPMTEALERETRKALQKVAKDIKPNGPLHLVYSRQGWRKERVRISWALYGFGHENLIIGELNHSGIGREGGVRADLTHWTEPLRDPIQTLETAVKLLGEMSISEAMEAARLL